LAFFAGSKGNAIRKTIDATGVGRAYRSNAVGAVVVGYIAIVIWTIGFLARLLT
jgi:hypothetical protein